MKRVYEQPAMTVCVVSSRPKIHTVSEDGLDWGDVSDEDTGSGDQYVG